MADFKFTNEEARKEYEEKLNALQKIVEDNSVDSAYLWDATVQKYAAKMEKVKKILQMEGINELITAKMFKDIDTFLHRCKDAEFHIALVGAIKADVCFRDISCICNLDDKKAFKDYFF